MCWPPITTKYKTLSRQNELNISRALCVREVTEVFSVVSYVIRAVHRFEFRLVLHERPNKWRPVEKGHAMIETRVFDRIYTFAPDHRGGG